MAMSPVLRQKLREVEKLRQGRRATIEGEPGINTAHGLRPMH